MRRVTSLFYPEEADREIRNGDRLRVGQIIDRFENRLEITGAVFRPGVYEYKEGITLYEILEKADGLTEDAFRSRGVIERLNERREPVSLNFDVNRVLEDPARFDVALRPDDHIRIHSIFDMREEYTVRVSGAVKQDTTLQFREGMQLEDAIFLANGFRDNAAAYRVDVARRITEGDRYVRGAQTAETFRFEVDENLGFRDDADSFELMPFDQVYVRAKPNYQEQQTVTIEGEVQFPGEYVLTTRNMRLSDLIDMAGGLSDYAYPVGASLERILEHDVEDQLAFLDDEERTEQADRTTSVGIRLQTALQRPGSSYDLILEDGDVISVPKELMTVRIEGEVLNPTSVRYDDSRSFSNYIDAAGGITDNAQRRRAYIVYANGEVDRTKRFLFFRSNPSVEPGATIVIPREPDRREMSRPGTRRDSLQHRLNHGHGGADCRQTPVVCDCEKRAAKDKSDKAKKLSEGVLPLRRGLGDDLTQNFDQQYVLFRAEIWSSFRSGMITVPIFLISSVSIHHLLHFPISTNSSNIYSI
jgi:protein involved in polysaccharide export with SLBB domain